VTRLVRGKMIFFFNNRNLEMRVTGIDLISGSKADDAPAYDDYVEILRFAHRNWICRQR
jgi:hypothetical protein